MDLHSFVKQSIDGYFNNNQENDFITDIPYLKEFKQIDKKETSVSTTWSFEDIEKNYIIKFFIQESHKTNKWRAKLFIYWKTISKTYTSNRGEDFEQSFGPYDSYEFMVEDICRRLNNNPLLHSTIFKDDSKEQIDNDILFMLKALKSNSEKINSITSPVYEDLKGFLRDTDNMGDDDMKDYIKKIAEEVGDKQGLLLKLNHLHNADYNVSLDKFNEKGKKHDNLRGIIR